MVPVARLPGRDALTDAWHISLRFGRDVLRNGMDPLSFIRYLQTLGRISGIFTLADAIPVDGSMDPESCYLGFEIGFASSESQAAIDGVFDFVRDDCEIHIAAVEAPAEAPAAPAPEPAAEAAPVRQRQSQEARPQQEKRTEIGRAHV